MAELSRKKILIIEDESETAALIAEDLRDRGFEVVVTHNGQEGLAAAVRDRPDLILSDISMPRMSGLEVLSRLNSLAPRRENVPFVFITARNDREDELGARRLGADDYIVKPIDFDILETIINARLAGVARSAIWPEEIKLSDRELEVLTWAARGKTSAEIAVIVRLTKRTVDFHLDNVRGKLGVSTRVEAVVKAVTGGLVEL
jgi:DNA-binding NarL/FixJ family response regulator